MVKILTICAALMGVIALTCLVMLYIELRKIWMLEEKIENSRAVCPIIREDGSWEDWDER